MQTPETGINSRRIGQKCIKDLNLNENLSFVPPKLMTFTVFNKSSTSLLPSLSIRSPQVKGRQIQVHQENNIIASKSNSSHLETQTFKESSPTRLTVPERLFNTNSTFQKINLSQRKRDVSYLMETKRHSKGHSINQFISNRINKSTNLMSSENQTSLLSKTVQQDHSIEISGGAMTDRDNIYLQMGSFIKPSVIPPVDLHQIKSLLVQDNSDAITRTNKKGSPISNLHEQSSLRFPKIIDAYKLGLDFETSSDNKNMDMKNDIQKLSKKKVIEHRSQNRNLLIPSGRKDVVVDLSEWLNQMLDNISRQSKLRVGEMFEHIQLIYTVCLKEIIRQVKTQCTERGQLLEKIWEAYIELLDRTIKENVEEKVKMENHYLDEINALNSMHQKQLEFHILNFESVKKETDNQISLLAIKKEQLKYLRKKSRRLNHELIKSKNELEEIQGKLEDANLTNVELRTAIKEAGINSVRRISTNQVGADSRKESLKKQRKDEKKESFYNIFDKKKDLNLFENLNLIDKLEQEIQTNNKEAIDDDDDDDDYDDEEGLYSHIAVDTTDLITKNNIGIQVVTVKNDQEVQCELIEYDNSSARNERFDDKESRNSQSNPSFSPSVATLSELAGERLQHTDHNS